MSSTIGLKRAVKAQARDASGDISGNVLAIHRRIWREHGDKRLTLDELCSIAKALQREREWRQTMAGVETERAERRRRTPAGQKRQFAER